VTAKTPSQRADTVSHPLNPSGRQSILIPVEKQRYHLILERIIKVACIAFIGNPIVNMAGSLSDRKPVGTIKRLCPPAIKDA
jgi:hypothetical protein